jgi:hypothetical protein
MRIPIGTSSSTITSSFANSGFESIGTINGSGVQTITFSSIPQNYTDLYLIISAATAAGNYQEGYPATRFNSDSGANYSRMGFNMANAVNSQSGATGQDIASAGATFANNNPRSIPAHIYIYDYTATDKYKTSYAYVYRGFSTAYWALESFGYLWSSTAAINSFTLIANTVSGFSTYAKFSLYGIGKK